MFINEINQLHPLPHISIWRLELIEEQNDIVDIQHLATYNNNHCTGQL